MPRPPMMPSGPAEPTIRGADNYEGAAKEAYIAEFEDCRAAGGEESRCLMAADYAARKVMASGEHEMPDGTMMDDAEMDSDY